MMKRIVAMPFALALLTATAFAAGTINLSLSQQLDSQGIPLSGCKLYFYNAGTTTPQNSYSDTGLTAALPYPLECDASGRIQQFFLADGNVKIRLADKNGVTVLAADNLLVIGPSAAGGGGATIDASAVFQTGDLSAYYGTGTRSGWVRANGRTIGNASSGATERAHADCQTLFEYLWATDGFLVVSSGRGVSANADWLANKTIALPDWRGTAVAGLDDMGSTASGRLTETYFGTPPTILGALGGGQFNTISQGNLPNVNLQVTSGQWTPSITISGGTLGGTGYTPGTFSVGGLDVVLGHTAIVATSNANPAMNVPTGGTGAPFRTMGPTRLATIYIKL